MLMSWKWTFLISCSLSKSVSEIISKLDLFNIEVKETSGAPKGYPLYLSKEDTLRARVKWPIIVHSYIYNWTCGESKYSLSTVTKGHVSIDRNVLFTFLLVIFIPMYEKWVLNSRFTQDLKTSSNTALCWELAQVSWINF